VGLRGRLDVVEHMPDHVWCGRDQEDVYGDDSGVRVSGWSSMCARKWFLGVERVQHVGLSSGL